MIKVSKMADYAVVIMTHLAQKPDVLRNVAYIAQDTHLPEPTVSKVMKLLNNADLVSSVRGAAGGYKINRAADDISVADIVTAIEGPIALTACVEASNDSCILSKSCGVNGRWDEVNDAIETALDNVSLQAMMAPRRNKTPKENRA